DEGSKSPANQQIDNRLIVLGERIGPLRLSDNIEDVFKLFGRREPKEPGFWTWSSRYTWEQFGLWIVADKETGNLMWISIDERASKEWAAGFATTDGIRLGMKDRQIFDILGAPERKVTAGGATSLYYDRRGVRFTCFDIGPHAGIVAALRIIWPTLARGDLLIVPGKRISSVEVGARINQVLEVLGGGYAKVPRQGASVYYWPHLGLSLVEQAGQVTSVRAGRDHPTDAANITYTTLEGVGVGSKHADVKLAYGEPSETGTDGGLRWQLYRSRGIAIAFDANSVAKLVDVFPAEMTGAHEWSNLFVAQMAGAQAEKNCEVKG
ncbi:MAG TPA: hypothetical protein VI358_14440, partial [Pseudolabrys sp.]